MEISKVSVILPSYKPDEKLINCVNDLRDAGFQDIIVVDDGGGYEYNHYFDKIRALSGCTVLVHSENRGKGAALKTAFRWYLENRHGLGVVTVDGDGQHSPEDVRACVDKLCETGRTVIGVRDFSGAAVPVRSSFGNKFSKAVFRYIVGMRISDTQTGLRAIPTQYLNKLSNVMGNRYEFETNMLLYMQRYAIPFEEVKIKTVYINENETSHFRPLRDSARIYLLIFKHMVTAPFMLFLASSMVCYLFDLLMFITLDSVLSPIHAFAAIANGVLLAFATYGIPRFVSSLLNFYLNRMIFHKQGGSVWKTMLKYYLLVAFNLVVGSIAVFLLSSLLRELGVVTIISNMLGGGTSSTAIKSVVKVFVDALLYFCSYNVQKYLVFKRTDVDNV